ncbi:MAG: GEVED domain-containing protein [Saprospiraceae bacterium]
MMKSILLVASFFMVILMPLSAQSYLQMMEDYSINVYDVIKEGDRYFSTHSKGKGSGYKNFQRWIEMEEPRFYPSGDRSKFRPNILQTEYEKFAKANAVLKKNNNTADWQELGPSYAYNYFSPSWAPGVGRVESMDVDPANDNIIYLGSRSGGFWKTIDGGASWYSTTQNLPAVGVVDIEVHPARPNEIYIVTRHSTGYSLGLLKSIDRGETWNSAGLDINLTDYDRLWDLHICPIDTDVMYCTASNGIYKTEDGGTNWNREVTTRTITMRLKPDDCETIYWIQEWSRNVIRKSTDGLDTQASSFNLGSIGTPHPFLAVTPHDNAYVYYGSSAGIWRSNDTGANFTRMGDDPGQAIDSGIMTLGVSATDKSKVFVGSLDHFRSTDEGATFEKFTRWSVASSDNYIHADGRSIKTYGNVMYMGTDGYLGKSVDNGQTWTRLNDDGTGIREFYRIGTSPIRADMVVGGSQDNGTSVMINGVWYEWMGADGMEGHFDRNNPNIWFGTIQNGSFNRTTTGGTSRNGIKPADKKGNWITPSVIDPLNDNTIFIAYDVLYKTNDNGSNWTEVYDFSAYGNMDQLEISPVDSNRLYISDGGTLLTSIDNGLSWTNISAGLANLSIARIVAHPTEPQSVGVVFSGYDDGDKMYYSTNAGANWTNLSSDLPNYPATCLVLEGGAQNRIYVGMDAGIFYKDNASANWMQYDDGLPVLQVRDMEINRGTNMIRMASWGRGLWESPLLQKADFPKITEIRITPAPDEIRPTDRDDVNVKVKITDNGSIASAILMYSVNNWTLDQQANLQLSGDEYSMGNSFDRYAPGTKVYFKIQTTDNEGNVTLSDLILYEIKTEAAICGAAGSTGTTADWIKEVELNDLLNTSEKAQYSDFTNMSTTLERGGSHNLRVQLNYAFNLDRAHAWVDWNQNLAFEASEKITMSAYASNISNGMINVPADALIGSTLMRVRSIYTFNPNDPFEEPCGTYAGEVEVYTIVVAEPALAVQWLDFQAEADKTAVHINWTTGRQTDNDYFVVQRSPDGRKWENLGRVNGEENTRTSNNYQLTDREPLVGLSYYRLRAVDINGYAVHSKMQAIRFAETIPTVMISPNPVQDIATVQLPTDLVIRQLEVLDILGRRMQVVHTLDQEQLTFSVNEWESGQYFLRIVDESGQLYAGELQVIH